jgi:hypothetical protein
MSQKSTYVVVTMDLSVFHEFSSINLLFDILYRGKVIVLSVDLSFSWLSRRVGNAETEGIREFLHQQINQSALSDTGRSTKDDRFWEIRHSMLLQLINRGSTRNEPLCFDTQSFGFDF